MRRVAGAVAFALLLLVVALPAAAAPGPVAYRPPVDAPLVDSFRPPASPFTAGNRGVDYATVPGTPVVAAADGEATFAGHVGGSLHVVVLHADGIRTSYSFLHSVSVRRGQTLAAGEVVGTAGPALHFGARAGEAYLDPLVLLGAGERPHVRLVPDEERRPQSEAHERSRLERMLRALPGTAWRVGGAAVGWARRAPGVGLAVPAAGLAPLRILVPAVGRSAAAVPLRLGVATAEWLASRGHCTPGSEPPPRPGGRRLMVLVGGLGSTSHHAAVDDLDTAALGYGPGDVVRFSYRGGTTREQPYDGADSQADISVSGQRLRALLERLQGDHPGVPIDVVAHSQGGLVARSALGERPPPAVANLVTLGTPHQGADLATTMSRASASLPGTVVLGAVERLDLTSLKAGSPSVGQLAEGSGFLRRLNARPLPPGVRFTSVAARGDVIVPSPRSRLPGAANTVVSLRSVNQHGGLPGSPAARREVALALAGRPPTCEGLAEAVVDAVVGEAIGLSEDAAELAAGVLRP